VPPPPVVREAERRRSRRVSRSCRSMTQATGYAGGKLRSAKLVGGRDRLVAAAPLVDAAGHGTRPRAVAVKNLCSGSGKDSYRNPIRTQRDAAAVASGSSSS